MKCVFIFTVLARNSVRVPWVSVGCGSQQVVRVMAALGHRLTSGTERAIYTFVNLTQTRGSPGRRELQLRNDPHQIDHRHVYTEF